MHTNNVLSSPLFSCFPDCFVFHCAFITTCQLIIHSFPFMQWMKDKCVWSHCILLHCIRDIDFVLIQTRSVLLKLNIPWYLGWIGKLTDVIQFGRIGPHTLILSLIGSRTQQEHLMCGTVAAEETKRQNTAKHPPSLTHFPRKGPGSTISQ